MADLRFLRRFPVLVSALFLTACGSSGYSRVISVNPADATVYVNGVRAGLGSARPYIFDFSECNRVYVQATHPDYLPEIEWFTLERLQEMIRKGIEVRIELRSRP